MDNKRKNTKLLYFYEGKILFQILYKNVYRIHNSSSNKNTCIKTKIETF